MYMYNKYIICIHIYSIYIYTHIFCFDVFFLPGYKTIRQCNLSFFPQIAIAIGVLTSNRGEGDEPLWRIGRGTRVPLQGAVDVVPLLGAIVGYHCSVLWLGGRVTTNFNFGGMDVVPLLGAIAGCHCSVLWWGEGRVTTNFGGVGVVPL